MISANLSAIFYLVSGVLFILALRGLSSPETSRQGNFFGILGMELAEWEMLLGLRWSKVEFSDIKSGASNFSLSGTNFMFGLGWGF